MSQSYYAFIEELDDSCRTGFAANMDREIECRREYRRAKEMKQVVAGYDDDIEEDKYS
jgi:hypothetical protein